ncbi:MAG: hypothetical protein IPK72_02205 [Candidatus Eisenbacteria bacterium]|nr:hypothetical protein [Candidatus Eisenbacteria bacterium]
MTPIWFPIALSMASTLLWQATLLFLLAFAVDALAGRWLWPSVRRALWGLFLIRLLVPVVPIPMALTRGPLYDSALEPAVGGAVIPDWAVWVGLTWVLLGAARAGVQEFGRRRLVRLTLRSRERTDSRVEAAAIWAAAQLGLSRAPRVALVPGAASPALFGETVLLPNGILPKMTDLELRHALLHEFAHWRRRDGLWLRLAALLQNLYWFFPPVHWARRRIDGLTELCCDATVAEVLGAEAGRYRRSLLDSAWRFGGATLATPALAALDGGIVSRLRHLEAGSWRGMNRHRWVVPMVLIFGAIWLLPAGPTAESWNARRVRLSSIHQARENLKAAAAGTHVPCLTLRYSAVLLSSERAPFAAPEETKPLPERNEK